MKEESGFGAVPAAMKMQRAEEAEEARQKTAAPKKNGPLCSDPNAWNSNSTHANLRRT
ncbi:hypothetical protein M0D68_04160 [Paraburkholderia sp. SEWSISQ10-3 4]|nr:hypothetical protein [Paraburkholderia aspalathi]MDN7170054.1 hypothetical protein [Paraburkholderia sp. SEWSISQ10-3 4]MDQ6499693.1 hypothetical protein [Paraburkholderia aspalathi]